VEAVTLSDDDARCQDNACPDHVICARWLQNRTGRVHQASFRKGQEHCAGLILCEVVRA
jgi:hypothetical protein